MSTLWISKPGYTPMQESPLIGRKLVDIPHGARVLHEISAATTAVIDGKFYKKVIYRPNEKSEYFGWIYSGFADFYFTEFPDDIVKISTATPDPTDAAQYVVWRKQVQYNLCGELCVLYITGWDLEISEFLDKLESASKGGKYREFFYRVFPQFKSRGTTPYDLDLMLSLYDPYTPSVPITEALQDPLLGKPIISPGRYQKILSDHFIVSSCHIDGQTGRLRGSGVLHWVVLEEVIPDRTGGWVKLYNPFPNCMERYSWDEFIRSAGQPYGITVKRGEA